MKTISFLKNHFMLMVALLTAGVTMSFKVAESHEDDTVYTYDSFDLSPGAFANTANWKVVSSVPACASSGKRPCNMIVPAGSTLGAQISGLTNSQVLAIHPTERKP